MKKFRVGRNQQRAILDEKGLEVALFHESQIELAKLTCELLNNHYKNSDRSLTIKSLENVTVSDDEIFKMAVKKAEENDYTWRFDYGVDMAKWMREKLQKLKP